MGRGCAKKIQFDVDHGRNKTQPSQQKPRLNDNKDFQKCFFIKSKVLKL